MVIIRTKEIENNVSKFKELLQAKYKDIKGYDYYNSFNAFNYLTWLSKCSRIGSWEQQEMEYAKELINNIGGKII